MTIGFRSQSTVESTVLGLEFFRGDAAAAVDLALRGGLVVAPSGPGLATLSRDAAYAQALRSADVVLVDSGWLVVLWYLFGGERLTRLSGLTFLRRLLGSPVFRAETSFWVMPDREEADRAVQWLSRQGIELSPDQLYCAPMYGGQAVGDERLLTLLESRHPDCVLINIGGGPQEKLGAWLSQRLSYRPALICTGAAIAFLSGGQARIPAWADRYFLGWLIRCTRKPSVFLRRYLGALRLAPLIVRCGRNAPSAFTR